jgi:UDP-N-acetylmuramate dehydrogenase
MSDHTTFKTGGPADLWIRPEGECFPEYAAMLLESAHNERIPVFVLGGGANLAVSDEGIRGIVLDTGGYAGEMGSGEWGMGNGEEVPTPYSPLPTPHSLFFRAGTSVDDAVEIAAARSLSGMEFLAGMPGSIGGALWMNARCYDREMADVVRQVKVLEWNGIRTITPKKEDFSYKKSPFQGMDCLILAVSAALEEGESAVIRETISARRKDRETKGHYRCPSAGSAFKNNRAFGKPTGQIIDELGLKGFRVGGAQVAPWHGNIIINSGGARSADILALVKMVEDRVKEETGMELEREILFTGNFY